MAALVDSSSRDSALTNTLQAVHSIGSTHVNKLSNGQISVNVDIDGHQVVVFIGSDSAVVDMKIEGSNSWDIPESRIGEILKEAKQLPPPQDFRFVVFSIKTHLQKFAIVRSHIAEIGGSCVVKREASDNNKLHLVTENGFKCTVNLHPNYPQVPGGVMIESLTMTGVLENASVTASCNQIKAELNGNLFRSLMDLVEGLQQQTPAAQ